MSIHQSDVDVNRWFLAPHLLERHLNSFTQQLVNHGYAALTVQGYCARQSLVKGEAM